MLSVVASSLEFIEDFLSDEFIELSLQAGDLGGFGGELFSDVLEFISCLFEQVGLEVEASDGESVVELFVVGDTTEPSIEHIGWDGACGDSVFPAKALSDDGGLLGSERGDPLVDIACLVLDAKHESSSSELVPRSDFGRDAQ